MSTANVKLAKNFTVKFTRVHGSLCLLFCTLPIGIKEATMKRARIFGESSHLFYSAFSVHPQNYLIDMRKIQVASFT